MLKDIFWFLQHNETDGCCPWCEVTPAGLHDTSSATPWAATRALEHHRAFAATRPGSMSPLGQGPKRLPTASAQGTRSDWSAHQGVPLSVGRRLHQPTVPLLAGQVCWTVVRFTEWSASGCWAVVQRVVREATLCDSKLNALILNMWSSIRPMALNMLKMSALSLESQMFASRTTPGRRQRDGAAP